MKKILIFVLLVIFSGCEREIPDPVSYPSTPEIPSTPSNLSTTVGNRSLYLTWQIADTTGIAGYFVYRAVFLADSLNEEYTLIDTVVDTDFADSNLQNGQKYYYKVSSYNRNGMEGDVSNPVAAVPNLYSLIINDGDAATNSRTVNLEMVAPQNTLFMLLSNSADFTSANWEPFNFGKQWILTEGEGVKNVYAKFHDSDGNITGDNISDQISYEILQFQYTVTVNNGDLHTNSRNVNLIINTPLGVSYMMISNSSGYTGAVWENYVQNRSWFILPEIASNRDTVNFYISFREVNNDSIPVEATGSIVLTAAEPVQLYPVNQEPDYYQSIELQWSRSLSGDFYSYRVFRSNGSNSVDTLLTTFNDISQTNYTDNINLTSLPDNSIDSVYYMVRFSGVYDDSSDSDTILVMLENNQPPPVNCFVGDVTYDSNDIGGFDIQAELGWSRSDIPDFSHYVVYENTALDSSTANPVSYLYSIENLTFSIRKSIDSLSAPYSYYYWLKVFDLGSRASEYSLPDSIVN